MPGRGRVRAEATDWTEAGEGEAGVGRGGGMWGWWMPKARAGRESFRSAAASVVGPGQAADLCQGSRAENARQEAVPDVSPLGPRNPGGGAFTFLRKFCYDAPAERVRLQEQKLWGIFSGQEASKLRRDRNNYGSGIISAYSEKVTIFLDALETRTYCSNSKSPISRIVCPIELLSF